MLEDQTARDTTAVNKLLAEFAKPAVANARKEAAEIQGVIDAEKGGFQVGAEDWSFYSDKVRAARFNFDQAQLKPYFELNNVLTNGVFFAAGKLYGLTLQGAQGPAGVRPGRARVRRVRRQRQAAGDLHRRLLRARQQARRRLDECLRAANRACSAPTRWSPTT